MIYRVNPLAGVEIRINKWLAAAAAVAAADAAADDTDATAAYAAGWSGIVKNSILDYGWPHTVKNWILDSLTS